MNKVKISLFLLLFVSYSLYSQDIKTNQKDGKLQKNIAQHLKLNKFNSIDPILENEVISDIKKIIIHVKNIFILDKRQSKIFVLNKEGKHLYNIGQPGQGPGDLEYPNDFVITKGDVVYVLNSIAKRIELFSLLGDFERRIQLKLKNNISYSQPNMILVDENGFIYVSYSLSAHLVDLYDQNGNFIKNLLKRNDPIAVPGVNRGNTSQISFFEEKGILHFDYFSGVFTLINQDGKVEKVFSAFDKVHSMEIEKLTKDIKKKKIAGGSGVQGINYRLWSNFWIDSNNNIFVLFLIRDKRKTQKLFAFNPNGDFLYKTSFNVPNIRSRINKAFSFNNGIVLITPELDIIISQKEVER